MNGGYLDVIISSGVCLYLYVRDLWLGRGGFLRWRWLRVRRGWCCDTLIMPSRDYFKGFLKILAKYINYALFKGFLKILANIKRRMAIFIIALYNSCH